MRLESHLTRRGFPIWLYSTIINLSLLHKFPKARRRSSEALLLHQHLYIVIVKAQIAPVAPGLRLRGRVASDSHRYRIWPMLQHSCLYSDIFQYSDFITLTICINIPFEWRSYRGIASYQGWGILPSDNL